MSLFRKLVHLATGSSRNSARSGVLLPFYGSTAPDHPDVQALLKASSRLGPSLIVILNANNGPGDGTAPNLTRLIAKLHENGSKVLGYVYTKWGCETRDERILIYPRSQYPTQSYGLDNWRTHFAIQEDIQQWVQFYPDIDGYFFDETPTACVYTHDAIGTPLGDQGFDVLARYERYSQTAANAIKTAEKILVFNPGTPPSPPPHAGTSYWQLPRNRKDCRTLVVTEETAWRIQKHWRPDLSKSQARNSAVLIHSTATLEEAREGLQAARAAGVAWVYFTDREDWQALPPYFSEWIQEIKNGAASS